MQRHMGRGPGGAQAGAALGFIPVWGFEPCILSEKGVRRKTEVALQGSERHVNIDSTASITTTREGADQAQCKDTQVLLQETQAWSSGGDAKGTGSLHRASMPQPGLVRPPL